MLTYLDDVLTNCVQALRTELDITPACRKVGDFLQSLGRYNEALNWYTRAVQPEPDRREMFAGLGKLYADQQAWESAIAVYEAALELDPNYEKAHWSLANIYATLGRTSDEIAARRQTFRIAPEFATSKNQLKLGNQLLAEDCSEEAVECYRAALTKQPSFFEAHYNLAIALIRQEVWQEAIEQLRLTLDLAPDYAPAYYNLGRIAQQQQQWQKAQYYYQQAIAQDQTFLLAFFGLGEVCLQLHAWAAAQSAFEQVIVLGGDFPLSYHNLGYSLLQQQKVTAAIGWLRQAVVLSSEMPLFLLRLGQALVQQQDWDEALFLLLQALQLQFQQEAGELTEAYPLLGKVLKQKQQGSTSPALIYAVINDQLMAEQLTIDPSDQVRFCRHVAQGLASARQYDGAILFYRLALEHEPSHIELRQSLHQVERLQQQFEQHIAEHYWNIERFPDHAWYYSQLAHLLADQGETEAAIALHRNALERHGWQQVIEHHYRFTRDWFSHNIVVWREYLQRLVGKADARALEIGCYEGMASCWLLDHVLTHPSARLDCIDLYMQDNFRHNIEATTKLKWTPNEIGMLYPFLGESDQIDPRLEVAKVEYGASIDESIDKMIDSESTSKPTRVMQWIGASEQVLPNLLVDSYDVIHVSACPLADAMQRDGEMAWRLLKPGGLIIFDYYDWIDQEPVGQESKRGIDAFLQTVEGQVELVYQGYQVIARKARG